MAPRYANGKYRDCKFCGGKGCLACPSEADKEYNRQFPNGPQPIATLKLDDPDLAEKMQALIEEALGNEQLTPDLTEDEKKLLKSMGLSMVLGHLPEIREDMQR